MSLVPLENLSEYAREVLSRIAVSPRTERAFVVALEGDLGAGKTTFVQALARALGVPGTVQSPTYVLMKTYPVSFGGFDTLVHIDAYRLNTPEEFATLKPETFLRDPKALVCIEWPERAGGALPKPDITLRFSSERAGAGERYIEVYEE